MYLFLVPVSITGVPLNNIQDSRQRKVFIRTGVPLFSTYKNMDAKTAATKAGLEESTQSNLLRIRITLTSTKTKALEQGKQFKWARN